MHFIQIKPLKYIDRISTPSPEPMKKKNRYTSVRQSIPPPSPTSRTHHHKQQNHRKLNLQQQGSINNLSHSRGLQQYILSDGSLSTIAEESGSYHSASIANMETTRSQVSMIRFSINNNNSISFFFYIKIKS